MNAKLDTVLLVSAIVLMVVMVVRVLIARRRSGGADVGPAGPTGTIAENVRPPIPVPPPPPPGPEPMQEPLPVPPTAAASGQPETPPDPSLRASLRDPQPAALFGNRSKIVVKTTKSGRHVAVSPSGKHEVVEIPPSLDDLLQTMNNPLAPETQRVAAIRQLAEKHADVAVEPLIKILYDPVPQVAAAAAEGLGQIGDPRAIDAMLEITRSLDEKLVTAGGDSVPAPTGAVAASGKPELLPAPFDFKEVGMLRPDLLPARYHGADGSLVSRKSLVTQGLDDSELNIRQMAAKAAIGSKDPDLLIPLVRTLEKKFEAESVRYLAAQALGEMGDERAIAPLLEALQDESVPVRYAAAESLGHYHDSQAVRALLDALNDGNEFVRSAVAHALGQTGNDEAIDALLATLEDGSEVVRYTASEALGRLPDKTVVDKLARRLESASSSLKQSLIEALGSRLEDPRAFQLVRDALRDPDPDVRFRASIALMNQESLTALDDLIAAAKELDAELINYARAEGVELDGFRLDLGAEKAGAARGTQPGVAGSAAGAASGPASANANGAPVTAEPAGTNGKGNGRGDENTDFAELLKATAAVKPLDPQYLAKQQQDLRHESNYVRSCAAVNLGEARSPEAVGLLLSVLGDDDVMVRSSAVSSLGRIGNEETVGSLMPLISDPSDDVRYSLVKAMGGIGGAEARHALERIAGHDPAKEVRRAARQVLDGMKVGDRP